MRKNSLTPKKIHFRRPKNLYLIQLFQFYCTKLVKDLEKYDHHNFLTGKHELQHNFACEKLATKMINITDPIIRKVFYA